MLIAPFERSWKEQKKGGKLQHMAAEFITHKHSKNPKSQTNQAAN